MIGVALMGGDAALRARRRDLLVAQGLAVEILDGTGLPETGPGILVIDDEGVAETALAATLATCAARDILALVLFRLPRAVSYRVRQEELVALGAADVMEATGTEEDFLTRVGALLLRRPPPRVLVIEDDARILAWVSEILTEAGMDVTGAASLAVGRAAFEARRFDALVVDRGLPDGDGLDFVARLRQLGLRLPALIFTAMDDVEDRVRGLREARADDYISKPVHAEELLARVQVLLRPRGDEDLLVFGPLGINRRDRLVRWRGALVPLRAKESDLLIYLAERPGLRIPQRMILVDIWRKPFMEPGANPVAATKFRLVSALRAFHKDRGEIFPEFILTEGNAYFFDPEPLLRLPSEAPGA